MIEETGFVMARKGDYVWVDTGGKSACGQCSLQAGCGRGVLAKALGPRRTRVRALNEAHAQTGENVVIGIEEIALLRGSMMVYAVPIIAMILFAFLGEFMAGRLLVSATEAFSLGAGTIGFVLGLGWVRVFARRVATDPAYQPVVLRRLSERAKA